MPKGLTKLSRRKRLRGLGAVAIVLVSVVVLVVWTGRVLWPGWFLWFDEQLAWRFTARWAALTAALIIVVPTVVIHLVIRSTKDAPERPAPKIGEPAAETAANILDFRRAGIKGFVVGADGRASTSQLQAVLWFAALLFGLMFLLLLARSPNCPVPAGHKTAGSCPVVKTGATFPATLGKDFAWEYLLLLGWPLAVAVAARKQVQSGLEKLRKSTETGDASTDERVQAGTPAAAGDNTNTAVDGKITPVSAKSPPITTEAIGFASGVRDLLCNDRGQGSLMDTQCLAFTLVTISYFLLQVISHPQDGLPEIPSALLVLMGISGGGYLTAKAMDPLGTAGTAAVPAQQGQVQKPETAAQGAAAQEAVAQEAEGAAERQEAKDQARRDVAAAAQAEAAFAEKEPDSLRAAQPPTAAAGAMPGNKPPEGG